MSTDAPKQTPPPIDSAFVAEVVRRVMARLKHDESAEPRGGAERAATTTERVVSTATIERFAGKTGRLNIHPRAVVTPAARDEAKQRGIALVCCQGEPTHPSQQPLAAAGGVVTTAPRSPGSTASPITDTDRPERAESIASQLSRRGVTGDARIVLSDRPAEQVHRLAAAGERAAMIRCLGDVDRFGAELRPHVWVLDMVDLNWIAAVNVAARILQNGGAPR